VLSKAGFSVFCVPDVGWGNGVKSSRSVNALMVAATCLLGCSPTYNWREVRVGDAAVLALMPCKPDKAERTVPLQGHSATLHMASCDVGTLTFAVAALRVPDGMAPGAISQAWKLATLASLKASPDQVRDWPLAPRTGWSAQGWQAQGLRHDGQPVRARVVSVGHGQVLHQLAVYGEPAPEVLATWLDGMRSVPAP
jgi:hypothetical protein